MPSRLGRMMLAVTEREFVRNLVTTTRPGNALAARFVAGESLEDAIVTARRLNQDGFAVSLNHLGEHVQDAAAAARALDDYLVSLDRIREAGVDANVSVKLTQLGLDLDPDLVREALHRLAGRAGELDSTVTIDMEESRHVGATVDLYEEVQRIHGNLGVALQAYLHRSQDDLDRVLPLGGHIRLCKGAYLEPAEVAIQDRAGIAASFDAMARTLIKSALTAAAVATHDDDRIAFVRSLLSENQSDFEFQMLYGVRSPLQRELVASEVPVRVYLPYGSAWYPYLSRRIAERPANVWFFLRAAFGRP